MSISGCSSVIHMLPSTGRPHPVKYFAIMTMYSLSPVLLDLVVIFDDQVQLGHLASSPSGCRYPGIFCLVVDRTRQTKGSMQEGPRLLRYLKHLSYRVLTLFMSTSASGSLSAALYIVSEVMDLHSPWHLTQASESRL